MLLFWISAHELPTIPACGALALLLLTGINRDHLLVILEPCSTLFQVHFGSAQGQLGGSRVHMLLLDLLHFWSFEEDKLRATKHRYSGASRVHMLTRWDTGIRVSPFF